MELVETSSTIFSYLKKILVSLLANLSTLSNGQLQKNGWIRKVIKRTIFRTLPCIRTLVYHIDITCILASWKGIHRLMYTSPSCIFNWHEALLAFGGMDWKWNLLQCLVWNMSIIRCIAATHIIRSIIYLFTTRCHLHNDTTENDTTDTTALLRWNILKTLTLLAATGQTTAV